MMAYIHVILDSSSTLFYCFVNFQGLRKEAWSISELVQAVVIMAHFHALSSFVFGCGIKNEPDHHGGFTYRPLSPTENSNDSDYTSDSSSDNVNIVLQSPLNC